MNEPTRYHEYPDAGVEPNPNGEFVSYADYATLREQLRQAEQDRDVLGEVIQSLIDHRFMLPTKETADALSRCKPASGGEVKR